MPDVPNRPFHLSYFQGENPTIIHALECFGPLDIPDGFTADVRQLDFWVLALKTQIAEIEAAKSINDWMKVAWELTDVITVAIDALAKTDEFKIWKNSSEETKAKLIAGIIEERLAINKTKVQQMMNRDKKFYEDKLKHLESPPVDKWEAQLI